MDGISYNHETGLWVENNLIFNIFIIFLETYDPMMIMMMDN
jgi:hypothetical protein